MANQKSTNRDKTWQIKTGCKDGTIQKCSLLPRGANEDWQILPFHVVMLVLFQANEICPAPGERLSDSIFLQDISNRFFRTVLFNMQALHSSMVDLSRSKRCPGDRGDRHICIRYVMEGMRVLGLLDRSLRVFLAGSLSGLEIPLLTSLIPQESTAPTLGKSTLPF